MNQADALELIRSRTDATVEPILTADELDELVGQAKRPDSAGRPPQDPQWVPTFDVDPAIAAGWWKKADRAVGMYDVTLEGNTFARGQLYDRCVKQAQAYQHGDVAAIADDKPSAPRHGTLDLMPWLP